MLPAEKTIGANTFYIRRYAPFVALEILGDLQQRFAGPLLDAMGSPSGASGGKPATLTPNPLLEAVQPPENAGEQDMLGVMLRGFAKISAGMNGRELATLARRLIDAEKVAVSINGGEARKLTNDMIEAAGMTPADIIALCVEIVKVNFADFFTQFASPIGQAQAFLRQNPSGASATH
jgi:hypothetical protein